MDAGNLSRRAVLGGSAAALATAAGCTTIEPAKVLPPGPDVTILSGAIQSEAALVALYDAVMAAHGSLSRRLRPLRDHHAQHLAVLQRHYVPGTSGGATATPAPHPTATAGGGPEQSLARLRGAEKKAASARAGEVGRATPALAQLLASIGACEAGHAAELS